MALKTIAEELEFFFKSQQEFISESYPGINFSRFKRDFCDFVAVNGLDGEEYLKQVYLGHKNHPLKKFTEKILLKVPLQYINQEAYFYQSSFFVNQNVLIPRSETEVLVEKASQIIKQYFNSKPLFMWDVGTGSGAIFLSLLMEHPYAFKKVVASDVSSEALNIAKKNFFLHEYRLPKKMSVEFICCDRLVDARGGIDLIVTNPPYIKRDADMAGVHHQVHRYEPHLALYLSDANYDRWFEEFFSQIMQHLNPGGMCLMEGQSEHLQHLSHMALNLGFKKCDILLDLCGRERFLQLLK